MTRDPGHTDVAATGSRGLRVDAERNRRRILEAARELFAEQGLDTSNNEIARRAGVGIATLLRRFPHRDELVAAAFADRLEAYESELEEALADPDPWHGFCTYLERVCEMQAEDRGFADVLTRSFPMARGLEDKRDHVAHQLTRLLDAAKATGRLRPDFAHQDVPLVLMANAGVVAATRGAAPEAWHRLVGYLIQSFATEAAQALPEPVPPSQMYRALMRLT